MNKVTTASLLAVAGILLIVMSVYIAQVKVASGEAFTGLPAKQRMATTTLIGPQGIAGKAVTIFASNPTCTARTISTVDGTGVGVYFLTDDPSNGDLASTTLTLASGHFQSGSTTVTYDSGTNGCGRWTARASASTTLTVVEYN